MEEKEQERRKEQSKYFGAKEFVRMAGFLMGVIFIGIFLAIFLSLAFHLNEFITVAVYMVFFITAFFVFPIASRFWKPANSLWNKVIGNENINIPITRLSAVRLTIKKRPWYYYLPSLWGWILVIILFNLAFKYFVN